MSIYPNVTQNDLINLRKLADQQKNQRSEEINNKILKQTRDLKKLENFSPITRKIELNESTKKQQLCLRNQMLKTDKPKQQPYNKY